jgi:hypothetical protein
MQKSLIVAIATVAVLTALPTVAEGIGASLDGASLALAEANGSLLMLQDLPDVGLRLAFASAF